MAPLALPAAVYTEQCRSLQCYLALLLSICRGKANAVIKPPPVPGLAGATLGRGSQTHTKVASRQASGQFFLLLQTEVRCD